MNKVKIDNSILEKISSLIKSTIKNYNEKEMYNIMLYYYKKINLIDENGVWVSEKLSDMSHRILPRDMTYEKNCEFIDEVAMLASKNEYLMNFINSCEGKSFKTLEKKFEEEGNNIIPDVIGYTMVLQNLTKESADDYEFLEELYYTVKKRRKELGAFKELPLFHKVKLLSIEVPFLRYFRYYKTRVIEPKSGSFTIAMNIIEATWADYKCGIKGNAKAGIILAKNKCGLKEVDQNTGAGPSGWSEDGKMIERSYPFPTEWASLYQTWNMCFVTRFEDFLYIIPKLLIPQVADYYDKPRNYMYNRAIALYLYLNFSSFDYLEKKKLNKDIIKWHDSELSMEWGKSNGEMAKKYGDKVKKAKSYE